MIYLQLFLAFLRIGAFSFGGGYAAMPLIQEEVVNHYHWISMADFTDLVTISQMTPGPIAINAATFIGLQMAGPLGAVAATLGNVLPSCVVVTIIAIIYTKYRKLSLLQGVLKTLRPAVVALIFTAGLLDPPAGHRPPGHPRAPHVRLVSDRPRDAPETSLGPHPRHGSHRRDGAHRAAPDVTSAILMADPHSCCCGSISSFTIRVV